MLNELVLFAGGGGGILGGTLSGRRVVCAVEIEEYPRKILFARQRDGYLPRFPVWDDVRTFDGRPWRGKVDVITGGFPCQDISAAGTGRGVAGDRSGLVFEMLRIVEEVRPRFVFAENSPLLRTRGLGAVLRELDRLGYDARWGVLGGWHVGAPHKRKRMFLLADSHLQRCEEQRSPESAKKKGSTIKCNSWWSSEPSVDRVAHGLAHRVDRLKVLGNGAIPAVVNLAWDILSATP